ncbi:MAG: tRNA (adenosine(37)-N6)-threonylcarbamoyltransferase complex ATPase subunit type 1 TsaE [Erysipelotrichaceae bacterium]|nr:tRNA (adenosine(37)-N6)-threonylcarbamoyltransferase complex ATPase subunit type 1 TsaE [Erysipelotrichaceae bacterium]
MKEKVFQTTSKEETQQIACRLGELVFENFVMAMKGDLGAGKTTFTQGLAKGMGIRKTVNSPTFTILKIYEGGRLPLYHMDAYRLEGMHQDLGFEEYIDGDGVCVIEWPMYVEDQLPNERLDITISIENEIRTFCVVAYGTRYEQVLEEWL